jgi:hypothetical protein
MGIDREEVADGPFENFRVAGSFKHGQSVQEVGLVEENASLIERVEAFKVVEEG